MIKIKDMEELLLSIKEKQTRIYMEEAYNCYQIGAFKACISLSFNSLIYDLTTKLKNLSGTNADAKKIFYEVKEKSKSQGNYENYLIEQLTAKNIISEAKKDEINIFKSFRNKCSHPSDFHPSAENARFVFHDIIENYLVKPSLLTTEKIDEIIEEIKGKHYFPANTLDAITKIIKDELNELHPDAYCDLLLKLFDLYSKGNESCSIFIAGMASIKNERINDLIKKMFIKKRMANEKYNDFFMQLFNINYSLFTDIDETQELRLFSIIRNCCELKYQPAAPNRFKSPFRTLKIISSHMPKSDLAVMLAKSNEVSTLLSEIQYYDWFFEELKEPFKSLFINQFIQIGLRSNDSDIGRKHVQYFSYNEKLILSNVDDITCVKILDALITNKNRGEYLSWVTIENGMLGFPILKQRLYAFLCKKPESKVFDNISTSMEKMLELVSNEF